MSEYFFEDPDLLEAECPEIFEVLKGLYRLDP